MASSLAGKVIVVTGAGAGIGKEITRKLLSQGASVVAVSLLKEELQTLAEKFSEVRTVQVDLTDWAATRTSLEALGKVDGLVNNAGVAVHGKFLDVTEEMIDKVFAVNVKAMVNVSQIIGKSMISNKIKGSIVNVSSVASLRGSRFFSVYSASKAAVDALTRTMALELGYKGIRVNSVNPIFVETELAAPYLNSYPQTREIVKARIAENRFPKVSEVANVVAYLLSEQSSMVNGVSLPIDGGFTAF